MSPTPSVSTVTQPALPSFPVFNFDLLPQTPARNGVRVPTDLLDWAVLGVADRADDGTLHAILGNEAAVGAGRYGLTHPWPEGSMLADLAWAGIADPDSPTTVTPGEFSELSLMVKDSDQFGDGGWGYGLWSGPQLEAPSDPQFDRACVQCHTSRAQQNDFVFSHPGPLPSDAAVGAADPTPNGLTVPADVRAWKLLGLSHPADGSIRVIVGNDAAASAARAGQIEPWPDGTMLAHYAWVAADNPDAPGVTGPGQFMALNLMQRRGGTYTFDGGWQYGMWSGPLLAAPSDRSFDRQCVNCHTGLVGTRDYVFTAPLAGSGGAVSANVASQQH